MTARPAAPSAARRRAVCTADRRERAIGAGRAFRAVKAQHAARRTRLQRLADRMTGVASSPFFLLFHLLWFMAWVGTNLGMVGVNPFDPFPFGLLTLLLSMEAIVLTIFVLMSQGREASVAELRAELMLQVNLRAEEEVTKTLQLLAGLYARLGFAMGDDPELRDMLRPLDVHRIGDELVAQMDAASRGEQHDAAVAPPDRPSGGVPDGAPNGGPAGPDAAPADARAARE